MFKNNVVNFIYKIYFDHLFCEYKFIIIKFNFK